MFNRWKSMLWEHGYKLAWKSIFCEYWVHPSGDIARLDFSTGKGRFLRR